MGRILVIRGGAIGDFILTLPALRLLREAFPAAQVELIGYRHIAALAEGRYYAEAVRSIEYGPLAGFFARGGTLDAELCDYFAGFQQVVSYLFDPDGIFEANLRRAGVKNYLHAYARIDDSAHAAHQLARPLQRLALYLDEPAAALFPGEADREFAAEMLHDESPLALHPGSGGARKNWPLERWRELIAHLLKRETPPIIVGGEAEHSTLAQLNAAFPSRLRFARDLPLPQLAAVLARCPGFIGHDSGISHIAAAVGTPCVLLFGPTDPQVWAPANPHVRVIAAPEGDLARVEVEAVAAAVPRP
ncbi:MAG: glycosyltransferase family 9 protein [Chthoniobacteraceae bacterium]